MPTPPRRWSSRLEDLRTGTESAAQHAADDLAEAARRLATARTMLRSDPDLVDKLLAEVEAAVARAAGDQERIQRYMLEARVGRE